MNPATRTPTTGDRDLIRAALDAALYQSLATSETESSTVAYLCDDPAYTVELIVQGLVDAVVIDEAYLLVYAIVTPWYAKNSCVLSENLVLRIGKGSSFSRVTDTMDMLAEQYNCDAIITGGALARNSRAITRMYCNRGFHHEVNTPTFTKRRR